MRFGRSMFAIAALAFPALASAQVSASPLTTTDERRLTPEQVEAVLAEAAAKRASAAKQIPVPDTVVDEAEPAPPPQVHGEVGFSVGTGGYREMYGTAIYPLGENGVAAISLDFIDWGHRRYPRW